MKAFQIDHFLLLVVFFVGVGLEFTEHRVIGAELIAVAVGRLVSSTRSDDAAPGK